MEFKVLILLATYNGEKYLRRQLDSLIAQTYDNWEIVIRDDNSSDSTISIVEEYLNSISKISLLETDRMPSGACANFAELFNWAIDNKDFDYLMFCDQDDIWLPGKIELSVSQLSDRNRFNADEGNLIYGSLNIIDANDIKTGEKIEVFKPTKETIISQNPMFGCTMMLNRKMADLVNRIPHVAENHDYWVALVNLFFGNCEPFIDERIWYRQHAQNVTSQGNSFSKRISRYVGDQQIKELRLKLYTLSLFVKTYETKLKRSDLELISTFVRSFRAKTPFQAISTMIKNKIYRHTLFQNLAFCAVILLKYGDIKTFNQVDK